MNSIERLISEKCPDGIETRPLGSLGELVRGNGMPKSDFVDSGVGCIHYGQIYTKFDTWTKETISCVSKQNAQKLAKVNPGDLIITNTSEDIEGVCKAVAWLGNDQIVTGGHATVLKHNQDPRYIAYFMQTPTFFIEKRKHATGTKVIDVSAKNLAKIKIPIPPITVQHEIVRILDTFNELEAELKAELKARKQQYEYYRNKLLNFEDNTMRGGVKWMPLGKVCQFQRGFSITKKEITPGEIPVIGGGLKPAYFHNTPNRFGETIAVAGDGAYAGFVSYWNSPVFLSGHSFSVNPDQTQLLPRFVFYFLKNLQGRIHSLKQGAGVPNVKGKFLAKFTIPIPPLEAQREIVTILDNFDTLVNDLSDGIPAEIKARRQQYEYYRDKLLSFKEAA